MGLDERVVVQEIDYPRFMSHDYLEFLLDTLLPLRPDDPNKPEWRPTPIHELDLHACGYGVVFVKDESDKRSNPTGTVKDRKAWELGPVGFRVYAENIWRMKLNGGLARMRIPRLTEITAGNNGTAQAAMNARFDLPPPKLLLDIHASGAVVGHLKKLRTDIYLVDLTTNVFTGKDEPYTPAQIRLLTNNESGHDITSSRIVDPHKQYYDWHVHESFNFFGEEGGYVFVPYGSGQLFDNYITWQKETALNGLHKRDVRLRVHPETVTRLSILAAEPERNDSKAKRLTGKKPFVYYGENDVRGMKLFSFTGKQTGAYKTSENYLDAGYTILSRLMDTEVSAAAGLGLYMQLSDEGKIDPRKNALIVNTGKGV